MTPLLAPTVHLNGTSKEELVEQRLAVIEAARNLQLAMAGAGPNGRDYYPQGGDAILKAQAAWGERMRFVEKLIEELTEEAMRITLAE